MKNHKLKPKQKYSINVILKMWFIIFKKGFLAKVDSKKEMEELLGSVLENGILVVIRNSLCNLLSSLLTDLIKKLK